MKTLISISRWLLLACLLPTGNVQASPQSTLNEAYQSARESQTLGQQYPFLIHSDVRGDALSAEVYMLLDVDYKRFRAQIQTPGNWCNFMLLTLNIKACVHRKISKQQYLVFYAGRKEYQPPEITYQLKYAFQLLNNTAEYLEVQLSADKGPMLTSDYQIRVQATPHGKQTLLRLAMSYNNSMFSRAATFTYLKTLGRNKIGFTITGKNSEGEPIYSDGMKAIIERNVMRYFLALNVYMDELKNTDKPDFLSMLQSWFDATERYHAQLHEYDRDTYIKAKMQERLNQLELQQQLDARALKREEKG